MSAKKRPRSTILVEEGAGRLEIEAAELRVVAGPSRGTRVTLGVASLTIGSAPDADLVLQDPTVSASHAEVLLTAGGYRLRDLGSKNGTWIGPWRIEQVWLSDGLRLELGSSTLEIRTSDQRRSVELAAPGEYGELVAHSLKMRAVVAVLQEYAAADVTVLIEGETGTGKEVAAKALHQLSRRAHGPFVVFDCGAVPPSLVAASLFGHQRGAFTGADEAHAGVLEQAEGGTLFLDEIGELPLDVQPMLLRAVDSKRSRRLGGKRESTHDVRLVAATHQNLAEEVRAGRFRKDLFYRLAVGQLRMPPLRERMEDVPLLARRLARDHGGVVSPELAALLGSHRWPGNVRELRNTIQRTALGGAVDLLEGQLGEEQERPGSLPEARRQAIDAFERRYVAELLVRTDGNLTRAAELAGVSRQVLTKLAAKHGLRSRDRRSTS